MQKFKDFDIHIEKDGFMGEKIKTYKIFDKEIIVHAFKIMDSKYDNTRKCLHLQISLDGEKRVVFTGSASLIKNIEKVSKENFPFLTTIKKENDRFIFT